MRTGILTFSQFHGRVLVGSSRIRGTWIIDNWNKYGNELGEIELFKFGQKYDCVIFQKVYFPEYARAFKGIKILDLCDPDWLHWSFRVKEMIEEVDAITCSSLELAKYITNITSKPVYVIPDRVDLSKFSKVKEHVGETKKIGWFGYDSNHEILHSCLPALKKKGLSFTVVSNKPYIMPASFKNFELTNYPWNDNTWQDDLLKCDVIINPKFYKGKWKYKSDNKTFISWALGLPVAHNDKELENLMTEEQRKTESEKRLKEVKEKYQIGKSVEEVKDVIKDIYEGKRK